MNDLEHAQPTPEETESTNTPPEQVEEPEASAPTEQPAASGPAQEREPPAPRERPAQRAPAPQQEAAAPSEGPSTSAPAQAPAAAPRPQPAASETPEHPMETEIAEAYAFQTLKRGQIVDGTVVSISDTEILIDVGSKSEGFVRGRELEHLDEEFLENLKEGADVLVYVVRPQDRQGNIILSLSRAQQEQDWREAERLYEAKEVVERKVIGCNRGGLIVEMGRVRGFAPASQLAVQYHDERPPKGAEGAARWTHMEGKSLFFKVIEIDRQRNRLILSERLAMREIRREQKEQLLEDLHKGDIRTGVVTSLTDFGAFVDLGGADGLIHLSELAWGQVGHPRDVLEVGQEVEVYVLKVDRKRRRIGLSLRQLQPEPWAVVHENYAVGQVVRGTITNLTDFGAFARVGPGIEGLVHISELSEQRVNHPREVVKAGQKLNLRIIRIEPQRRRMALSLKQAPEEEYVEFDWREASEEVAEDEFMEPTGLMLDEAEVEELMAEVDEEMEVELEAEPDAGEAEVETERGAAEPEPEPVVEEAEIEVEPIVAEVEEGVEPEPEAELEPSAEEAAEDAVPEVVEEVEAGAEDKKPVLRPDNTESMEWMRDLPGYADEGDILDGLVAPPDKEKQAEAEVEAPEAGPEPEEELVTEEAETEEEESAAPGEEEPEAERQGEAEPVVEEAEADEAEGAAPAADESEEAEDAGEGTGEEEVPGEGDENADESQEE